MTTLRRLLAVVLWHAGFAPSERIERQMASITTKNDRRAASTAAGPTGGAISDDQQYA